MADLARVSARLRADPDFESWPKPSPEEVERKILEVLARHGNEALK